MRFEIRRCTTRPFPTVYVTHDQGEAMVTSDRIAVMNQAASSRSTVPYALYNRPRTRSSPASSGDQFRRGPARARRSCSIASPCRAAASRWRARLRPHPLFSVRPRASCSIASRRRPRMGVFRAGEVVERAYLGESWGYVVAPTDERAAPPRWATPAGPHLRCRREGLA